MTDSKIGEETLTLLEERVLITRRVTETFNVRATSVTSTHEIAIDEPITCDQVLVERVPIDLPVDSMPQVRHEGETTVYPVVEEVLVVERRLVLKEEVRITRVRSIRQHFETVSLRSQDATVTRTKIDIPRVGMELAVSTPSIDYEFPPIDKGIGIMDGETLVAVYDTPAHAALAVEDLKQAGVPVSAISVHATTDATKTTTSPVREEGFWSSLFGGEPDHDTTLYERSLQSGSTVVTVRGSETYSSKAAEILESHQPVDMDERASSYGLTATAQAREPLLGSTAGAVAAEGGTIQLSEERLSVGKRVVNRGGTRIRRFVVETPVEESVTLREERVTLERRPVTDGRPVTAADFTDKTIEMTETAEEVVVAKQAFVTEEIGLKKTATERVETVRDTVRKEDVEIVHVPGETVTTTTTTSPVEPFPKAP